MSLYSNTTFFCLEILFVVSPYPASIYPDPVSMYPDQGGFSWSAALNKLVDFGLQDGQHEHRGAGRGGEGGPH